MLVALLMGFASGLPLLVTGSLLQAWMEQQGVALEQIGLYALVGLPYTLKFLWAPLLDRFTLLERLGRRRAWLLAAQLGLMVALLLMAFSDPLGRPWLLAGVALLVTFFSASQDIVIDAYRRESLHERELGLGSSLYVNGYRIGMLVAGSGGLIMADQIGFRAVYVGLALVMLTAVVTTLWAREPEARHGHPQSLKEAVVAPFVDYFQRPGAWWLLAFILLYKIGDTMAAAITTPFYLQLGFTNTEIGAVVKLFGFWATIVGGLLGGVLILRWGIQRSLWWFGILQALSTAGFAVLAGCGANLACLAGVIAFENLAGGLGTAAYVAFMASLTNQRFTATQYALLTSLMGVPRVLAAAPTGYLASALDWPLFFILCTLVALPGLWLARQLSRWVQESSDDE